METVKEKCQVNGPSHKPVMKFHASWIEEKATKIMSEDSNHYSIIV
jgi:hypothetical protein